METTRTHLGRPRMTQPKKKGRGEKQRNKRNENLMENEVRENQRPVGSEVKAKQHAQKKRGTDDRSVKGSKSVSKGLFFC